MWNFVCSNKRCEKFDTFRTHREHIERLYQTKATIDNKPSKTPRFLQVRGKKEEIKRERKVKIDYENKVLYNKMKEIEYNPSPYSVSEVKISDCPAFNRARSGYNMRKKQKDISELNKKLKERFTNTKTCYPTSEILKDHQYNQYLESILSDKRINPYINYATFDQFKKNLITIEREILQPNSDMPPLSMDTGNNDNDINNNTFLITQTHSRPISSKLISSRPLSSKSYCTDYTKLAPNKTKITNTTSSNTTAL